MSIHYEAIECPRCEKRIDVRLEIQSGSAGSRAVFRLP